MDQEIQTWFTSHGKVVSAKSVTDPNDKRGQLIEYEFEDGAKLTIRPASSGTDDKGQPVEYPQEIVGRELPATKPTTKATNVYIGTNPKTGKPSQISEYPDGHKEYDDTQVPAAAATSGQRTQTEGTPTASGQPDNERPRMVTRDASGKEIASRELTPAEMTEWRQNRERARNPGSKTDAEIATEKDKNKPGPPTLHPDGKGGTIAIQSMPDGTIQQTPLPGVPSTVPTVTVGGVTYERTPDGTYKPAQGIPLPGATSKNVDPFAPNFTDPSRDLGLGAWAARQRQKIGLPPEQGGITQKEYDDAVTAAHASAGTAITNITSSQTVTRQQAIDEQDQRKTLSDQGATDFKNAKAAYDATWQYANPNSDARFSTIPYLMREMQDARTSRERTAQPMPALHPMFTGLMEQAGVAPQPAPPVPAETPATAAPLSPGVAEAGAQASLEQANAAANPPPTAGEAGGPPLQPGPVLGDPAVAAPVGPLPVSAPPSAAEPPARANLPSAAALPPPAGPPVLGKPGADPSLTGEPGQAGGTVLPQPPAVAPAAPPEPAPAPAGQEMVTVRSITGQTMQVPRSEWEAPWSPTKRPAPPVWQEVPQAPAAAPAPPSPAYTYPPPADPSQLQPGAPIQVPGEPPGVSVPYPDRAGAESKMAPGPLSSFAMKALGQPAPAPQAPTNEGPMNPALANVQQQAGQPQFDPFETAGRMARMGVDSSILAQAMLELGLVPQQQQGRRA